MTIAVHAVDLADRTMPHRHMYGGNLDHPVLWWAGYLLLVASAVIVLMCWFLVSASRASNATRTPTGA